MITDTQYAAFEAWLRRRGLSDGTVELYISNLRACDRHKNGMTARLIDRKLAPKTRHTNYSSLTSWAKFSKNSVLRDELDEIRLPPASRVSPKIPLDADAWRKYITMIRSSRLAACAKAVILIMALRGLRVSDVLRFRRKDCVAALKSSRLVYEGKGAKRTDIAIQQIREPLDMLLAYDDWNVVSDLFGGHRHVRRTVARAAARIAKKAKLEGVHPHRLRRTYATEFLKAHDGDPQALVKLVKHMDWSGIQVASGYVDDVDRDELERTGEKLVKGF